MQSASELHTFLSFVTIPEGHLREIRLVAPDAPGATQHFCITAEDAIAVATRANGTANVYVGACPRFRRGGTKNDVNTVVAFWADLDFHQIDPNRDLALELAYRRIEALGIRPTMLVHSGNGLQVWWLLHQPAEITDEWSIERFESINNGLAQRLGGDHVHDLGRVLRVPGTMNLPTTKKRERGCVPVMARLLSSNGPTYDPSDFVTIAIPIPAAAIRNRAPHVTLPQPAEESAEIVTAFEQLLGQLRSDHPLVRTWRGDRVLNDKSRSAWDMALVSHLYRAHIREEFIPAIVRAYPKGRGVFATQSYITRTMAKGRSRLRGRYETPRTA